MTWIKICGITNTNDAFLAADVGADMLGFIFAPESPRYISPEKARYIIRHVHSTFGPRAPLCIGVFVAENMNPAEISSQCMESGIDAAQLVGLMDDRTLTNLFTPAYAVIRPRDVEEAQYLWENYEQRDLSPRLPTLQVDTYQPGKYGGTGQLGIEDVIKHVSERAKRLMLSGGLTPNNVGDFVSYFKPWAVDVVSGTELNPGVKDPTKVHDFIRAVRAAQ
jgi:indole-3-glycerol phosphate synthase/phosphoribosylanthranilate isomerase